MLCVEVNKMKSFETLHELLEGDPGSRQLYDSLAQAEQIALQEQRQNIRTREELERAASGFRKQAQQR